MIEIKHKLTGAVLKPVDADTLQDANLQGVNLDFSSGIPFHCGGTGVKIDNRLAAQIIYHLTRQDLEAGFIKDWVLTIPAEVLNAFCEYSGDVKPL